MLKHKPEEIELHVDHLNHDVWVSAKVLCDNVGLIPHDMIYETQKNIDDAIQLLNLARLGLEGRKQ